jgi:hypothetical protein
MNPASNFFRRSEVIPDSGGFSGDEFNNLGFYIVYGFYRYLSSLDYCHLLDYVKMQ